MATRFQLGTISTQAAPAGVVQAFAGASAPTGWLLCNGAAISRTTYAALFAAIASAHGSGDGSTTFNLPDYRGRIIRGRDGGIARDPDRASRTAANAGGNTGDNVGSVQGEATKKNGLTNSSSSVAASGLTIGGSISSSGDLPHTHIQRDYSVGGGSPVIGSRGDIYASGSLGNTNTPTFSNQESLSHSHSHSLTVAGSATASAQTITGDNETRPINAYVNYIIKV